MRPAPCLLAILVSTLPLVARADEPPGVVPALVGHEEAAARRLTRSAGFAVRVVEVAGPDVGRVASQDPASGTRMARGATVTLRVGIATRVRTTLPDVRGRRAEDALADLAPAYDVHLVRVPSEADPAGRVLRTDPAPGASLWFRGPVTLYVGERPGATPVRPRAVLPRGAPSAAPGGAPFPPAPTERPGPAAPVPALVGLPQAEAVRRLQAAGLRAVPSPRVAPEALPGHVYEQEPFAGAQAGPDGSVVLFVPALTTVPDVRGRSVTEVAMRLSQAGLASRFDPRPRAAGNAHVVAQRPAPGTQVPRASVVRLRFDDEAAQGGRTWNEPVQPYRVVPDLLGRSRAQALRDLGQHGFVVRSEVAEGAHAPAVVLGQSYAPGALLRRGTTVHLVLGDAPEGQAVEAAPAAPAHHPSILERVGGFLRRIPHDLGQIPKKVEHLVK
jgi:beta-lactam-binding protein with PASTA domain